MFASKDAEIEDLKKRLASTEKQRAELEKAHAPCDDLIASLRKQLAALEGDAKVSEPSASYPEIGRMGEVRDRQGRTGASRMHA